MKVVGRLFGHRECPGVRDWRALNEMESFSALDAKKESLPLSSSVKSTALHRVSRGAALGARGTRQSVAL